MKQRNKLNELIVIGLGEVLWDCFPDERRPGGAPANVAFHASQLGLRGIVCSRVGADKLGDELLAYLRVHGLEIDHIQRDAQHPTGTVTVHVERSEGPSYTIHENVAWDYLEYTDSVGSLFASAAAVCFGTLAQRTERNREAIHKCLDGCGNALRVYDVNLRPPHYAREWIVESLKKADVVKLNADEVETLCPLLEIAPATPASFCRSIGDRFNVETVVVTRGSNGCVLFSREEMVEVEGKAVRVADTVGAGDSFSAGLIYGLLQGWSLGQTARFANGLAGVVASRSGAMPELENEIQELKAGLEA